MNTRLQLAMAGLALLSCGKEVGRVPFTGAGIASTTAPLGAGDVNFWTDIDLEYLGDAALAYHIDLSQGGTKVASATCDPLGHLPVRSSWTETNLGSSHSRKGVGEMSCNATLPAGGSTLVQVTLAFSRRPTSVTLRKADLVLKQ
jgi:hypothetical protein